MKRPPKPTLYSHKRIHLQIENPAVIDTLSHLLEGCNGNDIKLFMFLYYLHPIWLHITINFLTLQGSGYARFSNTMPWKKRCRQISCSDSLCPMSHLNLFGVRAGKTWRLQGRAGKPSEVVRVTLVVGGGGHIHLDLQLPSIEYFSFMLCWWQRVSGLLSGNLFQGEHHCRYPSTVVPLEVVWASECDAFWPPHFGGFPACPTGRRPHSRPRAYWRDYISHLAWECGISQEELEIWNTLRSLLPPGPDLSTRVN